MAGIKKQRRSSQFIEKENLNINPRERPVVLPLKKQRYIDIRRDEIGKITQIEGVIQNSMGTGNPWRVDMSNLLLTPNLAEPLAEALVLFRSRAPITVLHEYRELTAGLVTFLLERQWQDFSLGDLSYDVLLDFIKWLNDKLNDAGTAARWSEATKVKKYSVPRVNLSDLVKNEKWKHNFNADFDLPPVPWKNIKGKSAPTKIIDDDLMTRIRLACIEEVRGYIDQYHETINALKVPGPFPPIHVTRKYSRVSLPALFHYLEQISEEGVLPSPRKLPKRVLGELQERRIPYIQSIVTRFHPTARSLVPFVLLLNFPLDYNADTIRWASRGDFLWNNKWFLAECYKGRAEQNQKVYLPMDRDIDHPATLINFLNIWTARLRNHVRPEYRDRLFLYVNYSSDALDVVSSWEGDSRTATENSDLSNTHVWKRALESFRKEHALEHFTLAQTRPTLLDKGWEVSAGDIKFVQAQANHKRAQTTDEHYTSDGERQRQNDKLGGVLELRTRWRETNRLIDPRNRQHEEDVQCATPGWSCFDPYDSPYSEKGKLCSAYGRCPACPLGTTDVSSPLCYAYSINLREAVDRAQLSLNPEDWIVRWAPVKKKLDERWLPAFDRSIVAAARLVDIPPLPSPE